MSEHVAKLKSTIRDLEAELSSLTTVDAETRRLLEEAVDEIEAAIHREDTSHLQSHPVVEELRTVADQFESSHPTLSGIVSRMLDVLGQMGI